jgi:non-specific serine/threonine protein kinase
MSIERLETLFHALVDVPPAEREERLEAIGRRDPQLFQELSSLIRADASSPAFLRIPEPASVGLPERLRKYKILREIGRGAAGVVYLAEDPDLGRPIAIKTLTSRATGAGAAETLREEARALAAVAHPNIAQVYSIEGIELPGEGGPSGAPSGPASAGPSAADAAGPSEATTLSFLTMEYVPGRTLAERLREGPLPLETALDVARQIAAALEAAHARSIVHRDLKPANVRVTDDGWVKVLDFGLALLLTPDSGAPRAAGTPGYMSPEQCRGEPIDPRSDLWSFGALLYESLTGSPATPGESLGDLIDANRRGTVDLDRLPVSLPERVAGLLRLCLEAEPERRGVSAASARLLLEDELLRVRIDSLVESHRETPGTDPSARMQPEPHTGADPGEKELRHARGNLPRPLSVFVGRAAILDRLAARLLDRRLVTLTGPGGVGKTRTALEVAVRVQEHIPGGCWFVDLSDLTRGADAPAAIARVLQLRDVPRAADPPAYAQAIADQINGVRSLILLDNCEHILEETARFAEELLGRSPALTVLATSRQPLAIDGEELVPLSPLEIPHDGASGPEDDRTEAVELFLRRARGSLPASGLGPEERAVIRDICRHLEGLPLAIELTASHARSLPLPELFRRIAGGESLPDLSSRRPARHRSLHDLVDWSYRLLPDVERLLLRRLSVFRGGCTLADAEAVCTGSGIEAWQIYEHLVHLVERSLVEPEARSRASREDPPRPVRYRLIESIRTFAAGRLERDVEEHRELETRYLEHLIRIAALLPEEEGPTSSTWVRRIEPDYANLIHGLDRSIARHDIGRAFVLGGRISRYWIQTGYWSEGLLRLEHLLAMAPEADASASPSAGADAPHPRDRIEILSQAGRMAASLGQREKARGLADRAVDAAHALGEPMPLARALHTAGIAAWFRTDIDAARGFFEEALHLFEAGGDRGGRAICIGNLGVIHSLGGDHETALGYHRAFLALCRDMKDRLAEAKGLLNLGRTEMMLGRPDVARAWLEEALTIHLENRDAAGTAMTHHHLGDLALADGRLEEARGHLLEAMRIRARIGDFSGATSVINSIARVIELSGDSMRAAEIVVTLQRVYASDEVANLPEQRQKLETWRERLSETIGEAAMAVAVVRGESRSVAELIAWVSESAGNPPAASEDPK